MTRLFQFLVPVIRWVTRRQWVVLVVATACTLVSLALARNLQVDPDFANLLPEQYPSVRALERVRATVGGGETSVDVAIASPSFSANIRFAEALEPRVMELRDAGTGERYFVRSEFRRDTDFLQANALYFATEQELDQLEIYLEEAIIDARLEANPFYFALDEEESQEGPPIAVREAYDYLVGTEYHLSADSTILVVRFFTAGSTSDVSYIERLYGDLERLVDSLEPENFHPEMATVLAGRLWRQRIEVRAITDDVAGSFGMGVLCVLAVIVCYFLAKRIRLLPQVTPRGVLSELARTPVTAMLIGIPLMMSLIWTAAVGYVLFGTLNIMTSALGLVLFGLGIDYGIHFYARYLEERGGGNTVEEALVRTFVGSGQAIAVGALTTAGALFVLVFADFKGFSEFGFLAGTGVLSALAAMLIVMPALISVSERLRLLGIMDSAAAEGPSRGRFPATGLVLGLGAGLAVLGLVRAPSVEFEYRFGVLEPTYEEWDAVHETVSQAYYAQNRRNPAYIVLDDPGETGRVVDALRQSAQRDTTLQIVDADSFRTTIRSIESLEERFPLAAEARVAKLERIAYIRDSLLADPLISSKRDEDLSRLRQAAQTRQPLEVADLPEDLRERFTSRLGTVGGIITVFPAVGLSDGRLSMAFAEDVGTVRTEDGKVYHAGSTSIVAADMLRLMRKEAPYMVLATLLIVAILMWINFGRLRWTVLALLPLLVGVLWMLLLMDVLAMRLNFYNMVVLPAVIGIGNDAGAHIVHRYREEGSASILKVLRSTGEHVAVGAITTMVGFGGLLFSFHPGLQSVGALAVVGIASALASALLVIPAAIQWLEDRQQAGRQIRPGGNGNRQSW